MQLRFTTKFAIPDALLRLRHSGRTRIRFSVNALAAERHEGGAARMAERLASLRAAALAGYPVGLTVAPILRVPDWADAYDRLFADAAAALEGVADVDLTAEFITHRFSPKSREVLTGWYPGSPLEMDEATRTRKLTKFGSVKWVFPKEQMAEMRAALTASMARPPAGRAGAVLDLTAHSLAARRRSALAITDTELSDIASAATAGLSRTPNAGYSAPAATGMPTTL